MLFTMVIIYIDLAIFEHFEIVLVLLGQFQNFQKYALWTLLASLGSVTVVASFLYPTEIYSIVFCFWCLKGS